jgi:hypothetical protein
VVANRSRNHAPPKFGNLIFGIRPGMEVKKYAR